MKKLSAFYKKFLLYGSISAILFEIINKIIEAINLDLSIPERVIAIAKAIFCITSLITSYLYSRNHDPIAKVFLRIFCTSVALFYMAVGGNPTLGLAIIYVLKNLEKI